MLIWTGVGFLVPLLFFLGPLVTQMVVDAVLGDGSYSGILWPKIVAIITQAILITGIGFWLNKGSRTIFTRQDDGDPLMIRAKHTFFFIPFQYWGVILLVFGLLMVL